MEPHGGRMRYLLPFLLACTEVSINKIPDVPVDSSTPIIDTTEPSTEPSTEPAVEPSTEPPEGIGGYVHYYLRQVACPACMGEANEITVEFDARFHEKVYDSYTTWVVPQGQCTENLTQMIPGTTLTDLGENIKAQSAGGGYIWADRNTQGVYTQTWYTDLEYDRDALYTMKRQDIDFASFTSFHGFDSIDPYELLFVDPTYAFAAPIQRSGATFWWGPSGTNTTFMITLAVYSPDGSSLLGYVACSSGDTGMMTIPGQYLSSYPTWALVAVHLARHKIELVPWEEENTFLETHMEWEVVGTGHIE